MEDILDVIISRRSIRKFKNKEIGQDLIDKIVKAGAYAPSGKNMQSSIVLVVKNKQIRDKLSKLCANYRGLENFDVFYGAPIVLAVLADKNVPTYIYDGSVVMENMLLEAHCLGLGACWIHHAKQVFETEEGRQILKNAGAMGNYEGIGFCILGYSDEQLKTKHSRKENFVYYIN